jgi:hypothetical protein
MKKLLLISVSLFFIPQAIFAAWWNPFTWSIFSRKTTTITTTASTQTVGHLVETTTKNSGVGSKENLVHSTGKQAGAVSTSSPNTVAQLRAKVLEAADLTLTSASQARDIEITEISLMNQTLVTYGKDSDYAKRNPTKAADVITRTQNLLAMATKNRDFSEQLMDKVKAEKVTIQASTNEAELHTSGKKLYDIYTATQEMQSMFTDDSKLYTSFLSTSEQAIFNGSQ